MGTLYLIDAHDNVLLSSKIKDTFNLQSGAHPINGSFVVNLPFDLPLDGIPQDLDDLINKKYAAMLSLYPGYANILFDEQVDGTGWLTTPTSGTALCSIGERQNTYVALGGTLESTTSVLSGTPPNCIVRWEIFTYEITNEVNGQILRKYREVDPSDPVVSVSFNGGSSWNQVSSGVLFTVPLADQGGNFRIRFVRPTGPEKIWIGSWALVY